MISPLQSSELSSPLLSEESDSPNAAGLGKYSLELNGQPPAPPPPATRASKKAKKYLRNLDKDLELIRQKNEVLVERSSGGSSIGSSSSPSSSNGLLLDPSSASGPSSASSASTPYQHHLRASLPLVVAAVVFVGLVVFLILEFANYEDQQGRTDGHTLVMKRPFFAFIAGFPDLCFNIILLVTFKRSILSPFLLS